MVADQAVLSSWRSVVGSLEDDARVSARLMGFVYLAQPQGLIGNTLLLAVPNETTRETLQGTQVADALTDALTKEFREEILLAISIDANLQPPRTPSSEARRSSLAGGPCGAPGP
ncbi:chromosomal replication initiation protein DnaA, partial [Micrococcus luteus]|nr:chromosomal replication initiation protein DnaA [Micrococcus luteus]